MMPATIRVASRAALRPMARPTPAVRIAHQLRAPSARAYSSESGGVRSDTGIVLAALAALGVGGYVYLKPVRDVAAKLNTGLDKASELTQNAANKAADAGKKVVETAKDVATGDADGSILGVASKLLPGLTAAVSAGGVGGLLSKLGDADIAESLDVLKKSGSDEVAKVVTVVQDKLKAADNKVEKVDWKGLASELNKEFGGKYQNTIDTLIGKIPTVDDFNELTEKLKAEGKDKLKDLEAAASKVYKNVEAATKDKKNASEAFVAGLKATKSEDLDALTKSLKDMLKQAGLPADTIVDYAADKAKDGVDYAEKYAKDVQSAFDTAAKWLPVDEEDAVKAASSLSPSLGKIVKELIEEAKSKAGDLKDLDVKDLADKGKKAIDSQAKEAKK